ncbi:MAG: carbohydrate ABC transporter permease [Culicoidibacterales bacterium]
MEKKREPLKAKTLIIFLLATALALLFLTPFYIVVINSFKTRQELMADVLSLPKSFTLANIVEAFKTLNFLTVFKNSLLITIVSTSIITIVTSMAAWKLVRTKTKTSQWIFMIFVASMLIPFQAVMLPLVGVLKSLGLNNQFGLILAYIGFGSSMSIFLYHGFIKGIPIDLDEAAKLDGCNTWQTYWYIIFPILKPIHVTVAVLNVIWLWNDFLLPSLLLKDEAQFTIPIAISRLVGRFATKWEVLMPALLLSIIPVIVFYMFAQKQIVKGVTDGAVK